MRPDTKLLLAWRAAAAAMKPEAPYDIDALVRERQAAARRAAAKHRLQEAQVVLRRVVKTKL